MGIKIFIEGGGKESNAPSGGVLKFSNLTLDINEQIAYLNGINLHLTVTEFNILVLLAKNHGDVISREYIMQHTKGIPWHSYDRTIDVLISRLRNKLKSGGGEEYIKTIHSIGYLFYTEKVK